MSLFATITFVNFAVAYALSPDSKTATTSITSIVHSKRYYCNSRNYNFPKSQITTLRQI